MTPINAALITLILLAVLLAIVAGYGICAYKKLQEEIDRADVQEDRESEYRRRLLKRATEAKRLETASCFFVREPDNPHQPAVPFDKLGKAIAERAYENVRHVIENAPPGHCVKVCVHWAAEAVVTPLPEELVCGARTRFDD